MSVIFNLYGMNPSHLTDKVQDAARCVMAELARKECQSAPREIVKGRIERDAYGFTDFQRQVLQALAARKTGLTAKDLAEVTGLRFSTVFKILRKLQHNPHAEIRKIARGKKPAIYCVSVRDVACLSHPGEDR